MAEENKNDQTTQEDKPMVCVNCGVGVDDEVTAEAPQAAGEKKETDESEA